MDRLEKHINLVEKFRSRFSVDPEIICYAPGRVNLIGEHVDYCGLPVLPIALQRTTRLAVAKTHTSSLTFANTAEQFPTREVELNQMEQITGDHWTDYLLCGIKGVRDNYGSLCLPGLSVLIDSNLPMEAGLSSSSALVVCGALMAYAFAEPESSRKLSVTARKQLAKICANAERYAGAQIGGMDQAISLLGVEGSGVLIEFDPVDATLVELFPNYTFVLAHSLVDSKKTGGSKAFYNERVLECRLGAKLLAFLMNRIKREDLQKDINFAQILSIKGRVGEKSSLEDTKLVASELEKQLKEDPCTVSEVAAILKLTPGELLEYIHFGPSALVDIEKQLKVKNRATHVVNEAYRVCKFAHTLKSDLSEEEKATECGKLLSASHKSLSKLYECSHESLDRLHDICIKAGALGGKLTGAGWGGFFISIVPKSSVADFLDVVRREFYSDVEPDVIKKSLFEVRSGNGADIIYLH